MYVKALAILLLLSGLIFGLWKLYDAGGDARENQLVREWQAKELKLSAERDEWKQKAEAKINQDKVVWRDRIQTIEHIVNSCVIPADILRVHHDSGVYSGEVRATDLQRANP
jgi:hypothetical protein